MDRYFLRLYLFKMLSHCFFISESNYLSIYAVLDNGISIFVSHMARILSIDYGRKRCGIAATDPLQIIVTAIDTIATHKLFDYLVQYMSDEEVEKIVFGKPTHADGNETFLMEDIRLFIKKLLKIIPDLETDFQDESFTSIEAKHIIMLSGAKKKKRQDKALVDKISAVIILQKYLNHI